MRAAPEQMPRLSTAKWARWLSETQCPPRRNWRQHVSCISYTSSSLPTNNKITVNANYCMAPILLSVKTIPQAIACDKVIIFEHKRDCTEMYQNYNWQIWGYHMYMYMYMYYFDTLNAYTIRAKYHVHDCMCNCVHNRVPLVTCTQGNNNIIIQQ